MTDEQLGFDAAHALLSALKNELRKIIFGQDEAMELVIMALIGGGHVLIEGVPGLGKTLMVRALAKCFAGKYSRVQFTPDLMPGDVTGHAVFNMQKQTFEIRRGPAFTNLLLADEINRAPAKTQSALLEVMQEFQITIEGKSYPTPEPFMVLATQNPLEQEGTYPLPEAELDRFMLKVHVAYPSESDESSILRSLLPSGDGVVNALDSITQLVSVNQVKALQRQVDRVTVDEKIIEYILKLVRSTRKWPGVMRGAGPRGSIAMLSASRARALIEGRSFVTPDDVAEVFQPAVRHRILLSAELDIEGINADDVLANILRSSEAPR